ncbi:MAG: hypothetical protein M9894_16175 [Planctomycetes bacterium]|nr:hypothetical protein [Planctomycetota bacterium]
MSRTPIVTYAGRVLGGSSTFDWEWRAGTTPVERAFTLTASRAEALQSLLGQPATLKIEGPRRTLAIEQVYLLEIQPGDDPHTRRIRLADGRWLWPKTWVATAFNLRRTNGNRFLAGEGRIEVQLLQPEIEYARWSLYPPEAPTRPWTAKEALERVVTHELGARLVWDDQPVEVELQDLEVDDHGAGAIDRVLSFLPGFDVYLDAAGVVHAFDVYSGRERGVFSRLPPPQTDGGWAGVVDRRALRPSKIVVLFTVEQEVRFDYEEPGSSGTRTRGDEDTPSLTNVAPLPDVHLEIDGRTLARSSWVDLEKLFAAWGPFGVFNRQITFDHLRTHALKYGWAGFEQAWGNDPLKPPDPVLLLRAGTANQAWRSTFRIARYWVQRVASIRPYRVGIVNVETGAYAPAAVYTDWTRRPSYKGFARSNDPNQSQGWAVRGYADDLSSAEAAPARVDVVDPHAGIISVASQLDPYGLSQAMIFGYPLEGSLPSQALGEANRTGKEVYARWDQVVVEPGWRMAVVLTVVPASPNTTDRFYKVEITPDKSIGPCTGPVVTARVFPGVMTARFAWRDAERERILAAIRGEGPWSPELLTNPELVQDVAKATAERIWDTLRDRTLGAPTVDMDPAIYPAGSITGVHHVMAGGVTTTTLAFGAVAQPADIWRYMNASTRRAIMRVLNNPGA